MNFHPAITHRPDPDHPGWSTWELPDPGRYHGTIGKLLVRADGPGKARCRMFPDEAHTNLGGVVHGGAILTFIDMALFAGGTMAGAGVARAVTLDLSTQFLSPGRVGIPLDAEVELLRETGRLAFFRGRLVQGDALVASFAGALRKRTPRPDAD
jgi:uncharacterized protein (TIGR00369 family)